MELKTLSLADLEDELAQLVEQHDVDFLLQAISKISPPERFLEIAQHHKRQSEEGGGFFGLLPEQMAAEKDLPIPDSDAGILATAIELARQHKTLQRLRQDLAVVNTINTSVEEMRQRLATDDPDILGALRRIEGATHILTHTAEMEASVDV